MAWIFGLIGKIDESERARIVRALGDEAYIYRHGDALIACGGNMNLIQEYVSDDSLAIVSGYPIQYSEKGYHRYIFDVQNFEIDLPKLDGRYAGVFINKTGTLLFTDDLGLRDFYYYDFGEYFAFSTDPILLKSLKKTNLDFSAYAGDWLLFNRLTEQGFFKNYSRLAKGETLRLTENNKISISKRKFEFCENNSDWNAEIDDFINNFESDEQKLSISLSGGLDSRFILSKLLSSQKNFDAYSLSYGDNLDYRIAERMANDFNISFKGRKFDFDNNESALKYCEEYSAKTYGLFSFTCGLLLKGCDGLSEDNGVVFDGGFGEIFRSSFLTKLLYFGKENYLNGDPNKLIKYFRSYRADIFNRELSLKMNKSALEQVETAVAEAKKNTNLDFKRQIDYLSITSRLPNYYAIEQNRCDSVSNIIMPFALKKTLSGVFGDSKASNKIFKQIIKSETYGLTKYPLAKGERSFPFYVSADVARLINRLAPDKKIKPESRFLLANMDYIRDRFNPATLPDIYDKRKVGKIIDSSEKADAKSLAELDWLLAFDSFYKRIF